MTAQALTQTQTMPQVHDLWLWKYNTSPEFKEMVQRNLTIPDEDFNFLNKLVQFEVIDLRRKADEHNIPWRNDKCQKTEM